jgi:hypothetical protein
MVFLGMLLVHNSVYVRSKQCVKLFSVTISGLLNSSIRVFTPCFSSDFTKEIGVAGGQAGVCVHGWPGYVPSCTIHSTITTEFNAAKAPRGKEPNKKVVRYIPSWSLILPKSYICRGFE